MIGSITIGTWLTLLINIIPSDLYREGIPRKEDGTTSKGYHQSAIPPLYLEQLFCQIAEFFALDINLELLEASELFRKLTLFVVTFSISTSDTMQRA